MASAPRASKLPLWPVDFNLLPSEYRPRLWLLRLTVLMAVLCLVLIGSAYLITVRTSDEEARAASLTSQQQSQQAEINRLENDPDTQALKTQRSALETSLAALAAMKLDYQTYSGSRVIWSDKLSEILSAARDTVGEASLVVQSMTQTGTQIVIVGVSPNGNQAIVDFARKLMDSGLFSSVDYQITQTADSGQPSPYPSFRMTLQVTATGGGS
ncbi:MAG: hypothetical protein NTU41_02710 [Chloroflexi bacterium]|nr:hypothetical protein [Chloroflexota bacterium]